MERIVNIEQLLFNFNQWVLIKKYYCKGWDDEFIYLQGQGGIPINCFYHVFGEKIDGEKLIIEYEGDTPDKYPGQSIQYSISGYHYDRRTL